MKSRNNVILFLKICSRPLLEIIIVLQQDLTIKTPFYYCSRVTPSDDDYDD